MSGLILHKRTNVIDNTPSPTLIEHGELAINYSKGGETLYIKNDSNEIVQFPQPYSKTETENLIDAKLSEKTDMGGVVLYSRDWNNANFGTITLSDNASNYKYLDIYCVTDDKHSLFQRVFEPNGKLVSFSASLVGDTNYFTKCKVYSISGNTISTALYAGYEEKFMAGFWGTHNIDTFTRSNNLIGTYRVVGYK